MVNKRKINKGYILMKIIIGIILIPIYMHYWAEYWPIFIGFYIVMATIISFIDKTITDGE